MFPIFIEINRVSESERENERARARDGATKRTDEYLRILASMLGEAGNR
jgi:hypothetical protein